MAEVGRDLWRSANPILVQAGTPCVAPDHIQVAFEGIQGDSTNSLGNLCHCSVTCREKVFPEVQIVFKLKLYFILCPLPLVLSLSTTEKSLTKTTLLPLLCRCGEKLSYQWCKRLKSKQNFIYPYCVLLKFDSCLGEISHSASFGRNAFWCFAKIIVFTYCKYAGSGLE